MQPRSNQQQQQQQRTTTSSSSSSSSATTSSIRSVPFAITCPGLVEISSSPSSSTTTDSSSSSSSSWNGSQRAQVILRLFARWCLSQPKNISSHINVILIDALVDAKGYISAKKLTKQLGLLYHGQIVDVLRSTLKDVVSTSNPKQQMNSLFSSHEQQDSTTTQQQQQQFQAIFSGTSNLSEAQQQNLLASMSTTIDTSELEFAINYRQAIPHCYMSMCTYFLMLLGESRLTSTLPEKLKHTVTHDVSRCIRCISCGNLMAWAEIDYFPFSSDFKCSQCFENIVTNTLKILISQLAPKIPGVHIVSTWKQQQKQKASSSNINMNMNISLSDTNNMDNNEVFQEIKTRLQKKRCLEIVIEQGSLFLELFRSKFTLVARPGTAVVHPDRVFCEEEFSSMLNLDNNNNNNNIDDDDINNIDGGENASSSFPLGEVEERFSLRNNKKKKRKLLESKKSAVLGVVVGANRPMFVEPAGVTDDWLPGLRVTSKFDIVKEVTAANNNQQQQEQENQEAMNNNNNSSSPKTKRRRKDRKKEEASANKQQQQHHHYHHHHHHSASFPPWLRDDSVAQPPAEEGLPLHRSYRDLSQSSSSSSSGSDSDIDDEQENENFESKNQDDIADTTNDDDVVVLSSATTVNNSNNSLSLATKWQAVHAAAREEEMQTAKSRSRIFSGLKQKRRQRRIELQQQSSTTNYSTSDDEWEKII